jgi:hypothetical protein
MNELRKAAEMALEALEIGYDSAQAEAHQFHAAMAGYKPQRHAAMDADVQKIAAAITALREAIAEQPAQQEPVAWMYVNSDGECEQIEYGDPFDDPSVTPLYTHPRAREPLTPEKRLQIVRESKSPADIIDGVEAAHGITKGNT